MRTILLGILILLLIGALPSHVAIQHRMGLLPQRRTRSGLLILVILALTGRL